MDFAFSEEQEALRELARKILGDHTAHDRLKEIEKGPDWFDHALWMELAKANLLGVALPATLGGSGLGFLDLCVLLEEDAELEESEAAPPDRRGQGYPEEVRLGELGPELVIEPIGALLDLLQTVVRGVVAENLPGEVAQRLLLLGEREVHRPTLSAASGASSGPPWR